MEEEVSKQAVEAVPAIVQAAVEKAKKGSLAHTKWLYSVIERQGEAESLPANREQASLADILLQALSSEQ